MAWHAHCINACSPAWQRRRYRKRRSPSQLDGLAAKLTAWLGTEAHEPRKQRRTLRQLHSDLQALGYTGSYDRVAAYARRWHQEQLEQTRTTGRGIFVPLTFGLGEAFQFDWSEDWAVITGNTAPCLCAADDKLNDVLRLTRSRGRRLNFADMH